ncbi:MAG: hypothetical protein ACI837_003284 [Crocinitomicaceae bacterium]|jgi:hypothetical protein
MTNNTSILLKKYSVPALFLIVGIVLLFVGLKSGQGMTYMMASILMLVSGILSFLYSSGKLKSTMIVILGGIAGIAAIITISMSRTTVKETLAEQARDKYSYDLSKQNLTDIRYVQKEHMKKTGTYLKTWEEFVAFVKTGTIPFVDAQGTVPARRIKTEEREYLYHDNRPINNLMTEDEAVILSKWAENPHAAWFTGFRRDTVQMGLMQSKFGTKSYTLNRDKAGFTAFSADSLRYIPYTLTEWKLEVRDSVEVGLEQKMATLKVSGKSPFGKKEEMSFGSLNSIELVGTWEND